jgi:hypothetical protein
MKEPKVFCVGWHKTGTTTMGDALLTLGYKVMGARLDFADLLLQGEVDTVVKQVDSFDALQDVPWAALYKELDRRYPGSKFILTMRDEQSWLNSASRHFKDLDVPLHKWLYGEGVLWGNEERYLNRYRQHYAEVLAYFENRPQDLLIMDLANGDDWEKLCDFLQCPVPRKRFPHSNKGRHSYTWRDRVMDTVKNAIPKPVRKWRMEVLKLLGFEDPRYRFHNRDENINARRNMKRASSNGKNR